MPDNQNSERGLASASIATRKRVSKMGHEAKGDKVRRRKSKNNEERSSIF